MGTIDRQKLALGLRAEHELFLQLHPESHKLHEKAGRSLLGGVPMLWMMRWAGGFPIFAAQAADAHFTDVDGNHYVDFCLGDTGAMTGHSPAPVVAPVSPRQKST